MTKINNFQKLILKAVEAEQETQSIVSFLGIAKLDLINELKKLEKLEYVKLVENSDLDGLGYSCWLTDKGKKYL